MSESKLDDTNTVNSIAFMDSEDGSHVEYDGPFEIVRDGGSAEVIIPADPEDYAGIHEGTAKRLCDRVEDFAVALADGGLEVSGRIEAAELLEGELVIRVNDGNRVSPSDVDIDPNR